MAQPRRGCRCVRGGAGPRRAGRCGRLRAPPTIPTDSRSSASLSASIWSISGLANSPAGWKITVTVFPELFSNPDLVHEMAYEEYRLRQQAGEHPEPDEYRRRFGLTGRDWPSEISPPPRIPLSSSDPTGNTPRSSLGMILGSSPEADEQAEFLRTLDRTDPHAAERLAQAVNSLPQVGSTFLGFRLCSELGRGAFGRVFLARQGDLAGRPVVLKVSADVAGETHALARLQHTNIVPIFSVHRSGPLQAVCMPYLGATTLADTLSELRQRKRLPETGEALLSTLRSRRGPASSAASAEVPSETGIEQSRVADLPAPTSSLAASADRLRALGYVPAVLWIMARVAGGLAHAHERGILHRDLKPANILFADDGEPVLLDFNLAADLTSRVGASVALIGGTLAYMAPEHLEAFRDGKQAVDARSDVYAIGVILHELLTGTSPFPIRRGLVDAILPQMIADRQTTPTDVRLANPGVSPAVASIVRHCLEPDPSRRYQTARRAAGRPGAAARRPAASPRPRALTPRTAGEVVAAASAIDFFHHGCTCRRRAAGRQSARRSSSDTTSISRARQWARFAGWATNGRKHGVADDTAGGSGTRRGGAGPLPQAFDRYEVLGDTAWAGRPLSGLAAVRTIASALRRYLGELLTLSAQALFAGRARRTRPDDRGPGHFLVAPGSGWACFEADAIAISVPAHARNGCGWKAVRERGKSYSCPGGGAFARERCGQLLFEDPGAARSRTTTVLVVPARPSRTVSTPKTGPSGLPSATGTSSSTGRRGPGRLRRGGRIWRLVRAPHYLHGLIGLDLASLRAMEDFDRALSLRPDLVSALAQPGAGKARFERRERGRRRSDDVSRPGKGAERAWFIRSRARRMTRRPGGGCHRSRNGLRSDPHDPDSFVARGLARLPADPKAARTTLTPPGPRPATCSCLAGQGQPPGRNLGAAR